MSFDVLVSGLNVVDLLVTMPESYTPGGKHEVNNIVIQGGAPAGNGACAMASLGLKTAFAGFLGNNPQSDIAKAELERHNVDTSLMLTDSDAVPATALVAVEPDSGERTVFYTTQGYRALSSQDINPKWLENSRLLYVDAYDLQANIPLLRLAKQFGIESVVDMESGDPERLKQMLVLAKHVILPLEAAQMLSNETMPEQCLFSLGRLTDAQLIITDGENGSWALVGDSIHHQPCFAVSVTDTTGCGDAYHASYAYALLNNFSLEQRMQFAAAFAAIVATYFGGRTYFPTVEEVMAFIKNYE